MYKWENKLIDFIRKHLAVLVMLLITLISILTRSNGMGLSSGDYYADLEPWFQQLKSGGGLPGLGDSVGNYYIPYLVLMAIMTYLPFSPLLMIKLLSIFFEYLCALLAMKLTFDILKDKVWSVAVFGLIILSPIVILNGAYWGQCDYIYVAFILASIICFRNKKMTLSFVFLGIAFAFKLQALLILPAYILYYVLNREYSIKKFLWIPLIYYITGMPAILFGRWDVYSIYISQTGAYTHLNMNIGNIWSFFPDRYRDFAAWGIGGAVVIPAILVLYLSERQYRLNFQSFLLTTVAITGVCVMVLPGMHERYIALYCLLATVYFMIYDRKRIWIALLIQFAALPTYLFYLYSLEINNYYPIIAVINVGTLIYLIYYMMKHLKLSEHGAEVGAGITRAVTPKIISLCFAAVLILYTAIFHRPITAGLLYDINVEFRTDIRTLMERFPEYAGSSIYIENSGNIRKTRNQWEGNLVLDSERAGNLECMDGGVPLFLEDQDGILIISKELFPDYAQILTGRVILLDGEGYLVFTNDFY